MTPLTAYLPNPAFRRIFWFLAACFIFQKIFILSAFHCQYTDNDQLIYWNMVKDYSRGIFHEPFFYGQDYNFPLEAWLSVPGYRMGIPLQIILPVVALLLAITPFILILSKLYTRKQYISASLILLLLCTVSTKYDLMTGIPRGFVQGLFTASLALLLIEKISYIRLFAIGFLLCLAFAINPNSLFLSICIVFFYIYRHRSQLKTMHWLLFFAGAVLAYGLHWQCNHFYAIHPAYNLHHKDPLEYHVSDLNRIGELDAMWTGLSPLVWEFAAINILIFLAFIVYFFRKKKNALAWFTLFLLLVILASVAVSKCADGNRSFLFPYSRFYLSIPVIYALLLLQTGPSQFNIRAVKVYSVICLLLGLGYTIFKIVGFNEYVKNQLAIDAGIQCIRVDKLRDRCLFIQNKMELTHTNLLINADRDDKINYGCPCFWNNDSLQTLNIEYERRTWRIATDSIITRPRLMMLFWDNYKVTRIDSTYKPITGYLYLVEKPGMPATEWLKSKGYNIRSLPPNRK